MPAGPLRGPQSARSGLTPSNSALISPPRKGPWSTQGLQQICSFSLAENGFVPLFTKSVRKNLQLWRLPSSWASGHSTAGTQRGRARESLLQAAWRCLPWPEPSRGRALLWPDHTHPPPPPWDLAQVCVLSEPLAQEEGRPRRGWPTPRLTTRTRRPARVSEPFHMESGLGELQSGPGAGLSLSPLESEGCPGDAALEGQSAPACVFQRTDNVKSSTKKESENPLPWSLLPHSTRPAT